MTTPPRDCVTRLIVALDRPSAEASPNQNVKRQGAGKCI